MQSRGIQWAPRLGFSWSPFGTNGKMVVHGGGGISYNRTEGETVFNELSDPPGLVESSLYYGNLDGLNSAATPLQPIAQSTGSAPDVISGPPTISISAASANCRGRDCSMFPVWARSAIIC